MTVGVAVWPTGLVKPASLPPHALQRAQHAEPLVFLHTVAALAAALTGPPALAGLGRPAATIGTRLELVDGRSCVPEHLLLRPVRLPRQRRGQPRNHRPQRVAGLALGAESLARHSHLAGPSFCGGTSTYRCV